MKKAISPNIPLLGADAIREIRKRQGLPWNDGKISEYEEFPILQTLFHIINSGIPRQDFFYQGDLFRLHTPYPKLTDDVDLDNEEVVRKSPSSRSCVVLPITMYSESVVAFSKSCDFTDTRIYNKVIPSETARLIHINTGNKFGIDINKLMARFGCADGRFEGEEEVLFPLLREFVVKEYRGTPNQFRYYLRSRGRQ